MDCVHIYFSIFTYALGFTVRLYTSLFKNQTNKHQSNLNNNHFIDGATHIISCFIWKQKSSWNMPTHPETQNDPKVIYHCISYFHQFQISISTAFLGHWYWLAFNAWTSLHNPSCSSLNLQWRSRLEQLHWKWGLVFPFSTLISSPDGCSLNLPFLLITGCWNNK